MGACQTCIRRSLDARDPRQSTNRNEAATAHHQSPCSSLAQRKSCQIPIDQKEQAQGIEEFLIQLQLCHIQEGNEQQQGKDAPAYQEQQAGRRLEPHQQEQ